MPRIDPLKLLVCLSVLLAPNGGIRSANEVKRLANLMAKFSKKLVSKCIYIQILKCTETELLGQFMAAGGWSLVHMWLADGITTKNWPLIQELLELLLCCPVDVERLKSNTAPKLVKTLSKDSSHEGVRLLATKLVEQWLKIARNDIRSGNQQQSQQSSQQSSPAQQSGSSSSDDKSRNPEDTMSEENKDVDESSHEEEEEVLDETTVIENGDDALDAVAIEAADAEPTEDGVMDETAEGKNDEGEEDVEEAKKAFNAAVADGNSKKSPLLFKITMKNGKQVLAKVESPTKKGDASLGDDEEEKPNVEEDGIKDEVKEEDQDQTLTEEGDPEVEETDSKEKLNKSVSDNGDKDEKKDKSEVEKEKDKDRRKSVEKDRSKESKEKISSKDKDKHRDKKSSSSGHRSSSSKSSSSSSKHNSSTSSNSSKSKSTSSSSTGKSSSSSSKDKDKEKDRNSSSSKQHHKHSSSSKTSSRSSSSSSSNDKHREHKDKEKSSHSSKDKEGHPKISSPASSSKLDKNPKKSRDGADEKSDSSADNSRPSPANSNKKASISIEVRNSEHRPKTVKTFNSQFRSHGLIEEAPPPPSRKGLKKPLTTTTLGVVGSTATGTVHTKRPSPPPSSKEGPPEKKAREDPAERPGAIKLIPPKRQPSLIESDMFMDALSATLKKDVKKRKRKLSGSEPGKVGDHKAGTAPSTPTTPTTPTPEKSLVAAKAASPEKTILLSPPTSPTREDKEPATSTTAAVGPSSPVSSGPASPTNVVAAPMSFYRDTLADSEETAEDKKEQPEKSEPADAPVAAEPESAVETKPEEIPDTPAEPDDEDEDVVKKPKRLKSEVIEDDDADDRNDLIDAVGDDVAKKMEAEVPEKKLPGPGCGPDGPPGVLVIHRRKGPKKQLKWKAQEDLEEVRYFELDVTERCNVTRTFTDLKHLERVDERNKYMLARKVDAEDMMVERTAWLPLIAIDNVPPHPEGVNSQERRIQQNRERTILQALYFNRHMIPDSPAEPDVDVYSISEPMHIPMDDVTGNPDSINDFTSMPWPEPKSTPPHESAGFNSPFFTGSANDFPPFGNTSNWELPGANNGPLPGMFPPGRMGPIMPPMGGNNGPPPGAPPMMRQMNMPSNMPHNMPPNMGAPHPNMFQNNFVRGPHPMQQHMNDRDDETFRNGPPPPPAWFGGNSREGNNRGPPPHQGNFNNRGGGGRGGGGNWNNNRDHDRGGPRGSNYRPPWLNNNRGNQNNHRGGGGGRKW
ncbi:muscle M-line assembly protein unc-89-like [Ochlerotatus camptorhynchus]|uniref:muscle M-line assembly protein unc-89-like n=1 Tax=Ochlerotatus camptorhynchus TaxID=644619 RepID=UPI0031D64958